MEIVIEHNHKKWKDSLKTRATLLIFSLELEISRIGRTRNTSKQRKMADFTVFHCCFEEFLSENDFEAVLDTFSCYDYGANASEAVEKIATDQKDDQKCSLCVIVCCIVKA